jgi:rare lipoprotein A (peptidoglycan hydrolase)/LysM repeat protein
MKQLLIIVLLLPTILFAQNKPLLVDGVAPNLYLVHTVAPKENYYSIGRLYNVSPKEIAPFNELQLEKGLSLNQVVKIPLVANNFTQTNELAPDEVLVPVYYQIKQKEGLYRVAMNNNKLDIDLLKRWNNIKGESVPNGSKLIVGYLKVKKELSALASKAVATPVAATKPTEPVKTAPTKPTVAPETTPVVKNTTKPTEPVKTVTTKPDITNETLPVVKNPTKEKPVETTPVITQPEQPKVAKNFNGGLFKNEYEKQVAAANIASETGTAAIFKSTSGWEDGKYYCLHNSATPGSILKITNTSSGKSVYAKVLDVMPDIKQNNDLVIRLSNAAASELGATDNKFDCTISFSK